MNKTRKICFVLTSLIHYSRMSPLIKELLRDSNIELQLFVAGGATLTKYGDLLQVLKEDGLTPTFVASTHVEGSTGVTTAKSAAILMVDTATFFNNTKPDMVIVRGDRSELLSVAAAAAFMNIFIVHFEGGDLSGSIDESVRHAITKLAHLHFVTNENSMEVVRKMGENSAMIKNVGALELNALPEKKTEIDRDYINKSGVGYQIDFNNPYLMVMYHPDTYLDNENKTVTEEILKAINILEIQVIWFWPNNDSGSELIASAIRRNREILNTKKIRFLRYVAPQTFLALLVNTRCLVGNSSAGIKECSYLGIPAVNIGQRQKNRMKGENVIDTGVTYSEIENAIRQQLKVGRYPRSDVYFKETGLKMVTELLKSIPLNVRKEYFNN